MGIAEIVAGVSEDISRLPVFTISAFQNANNSETPERMRIGFAETAQPSPFEEDEVGEGAVWCTLPDAAGSDRRMGGDFHLWLFVRSADDEFALGDTAAAFFDGRASDDLA